MIHLRVARVAATTGRTLQALLEGRGVQTTLNEPGIAGGGVVCYGWGTGDGFPIPTLNANAGQYNKFDELMMLAAAGVPVPRAINSSDGTNFPFPAFARKYEHSGGRDLRVVLSADELPARIEAGWNFFTEVLPVQTEYRVWVYRGRHLATYEKYLAHRERFRGYGRNTRNGFAFGLRDESPYMTRVAGEAVDALGLDFGGVDVIRKQDGTLAVLEVNSAPGIQGDHRQAIVRLAAKIARWEQLGYPKRRRREDTDVE